MELSPDECYRALVARDARFDGVFLVGVSTTGIYCRPVCPSRTPRRENCTFYANAADAEADGYRPCLRCRPPSSKPDRDPKIFFALIDSPLDWLMATSDGESLTGVYMTPHRHGPEAGSDWVRDDALPVLVEAANQLRDYFAGELREFSLPLAMNGTEFQRRVWSELQRIPYGETISYGELAGRIGRPGSSRAVGLANGGNPLSIVVPCHRVIGSTGKLTGYGGGVERKRALLDFESDVVRFGPHPLVLMKAAGVETWGGAVKTSEFGGHGRAKSRIIIRVPNA